MSQRNLAALGKGMTRWSAAAAVVAALALTAAPAWGQAPTHGARVPPPSVQAAKGKLAQLAQRHRLPITQRNGLTFVNLTQKPGIGQDYVNTLGPNVVEFFKTPRHGKYHHLYTRIGDKTWSRIWDLSSSQWYPASGGTERIGVLVQLTPSEMTRLNKFMDQNRQNPRGNNQYGSIGSFNVGGGGCNTTHCTNYLEKAKIGDNGETLPRLLNRYGTGIAPSWIRGLMDANNPRVVGVVVHNAGEAEFNNPSALSKFFD